MIISCCFWVNRSKQCRAEPEIAIGDSLAFCDLHAVEIQSKVSADIRREVLRVQRIK